MHSVIELFPSLFSTSGDTDQKEGKKHQQNTVRSKNSHENSYNIALSKLKESDSEIVDMAVPQLPERSYLEDTAFVSKLEVELFPEAWLTSQSAPKGSGSMLPELPERRYLEVGGETELLPPKALVQRHSDGDDLSGISPSSNIPEDTKIPEIAEGVACARIQALPGAQIQAVPGAYEELKGVVNRDDVGHYMSLSDATREKGPSSGGQDEKGSSTGQYRRHHQDDCLYEDIELPSQDKGHSEGQYMSLSICEAHKESQSEGHYMTLSESTREKRTKIIPWGFANKEKTYVQSP